MSATYSSRCRSASLGFWQLRRADEKLAYQAQLDARAALPALDGASLLQPMNEAERSSLQHRQVVLRGEWLPQYSVYLDNRQMQFLYESDGAYNFMDNENFEQTSMTAEQLGSAKNFLKENMNIGVQCYQGAIMGVELPVAVELRVVETDPGIRGDTATGGTKPAKLETGHVVKVPFFINVGDVLRVDTRTGDYLERA